MSAGDVYSAVKSAGIPCAHFAWAEGKAPSLPWAVYYLSDLNGFCADNTMYAAGSRWCVELYQRVSDPELEGRLERAILSKFTPYTKSESYVADENCFQTTYYFKDYLS